MIIRDNRPSLMEGKDLCDSEVLSVARQGNVLWLTVGAGYSVRLAAYEIEDIEKEWSKDEQRQDNKGE